MKVALTLALLATAGSLLAFTNGEPPPTETTAPPAATEATTASLSPSESASGAEEPPNGCGLDGGTADCATPTGDIGEPFTAVLFEGRGAEFWHWEAVLLERKVERLERRLQKRWEPTVDYAITLASVVYGVPRWELSSVAECESHKNPFARNRSSDASGVMQFLPSTWAGSWGAKIFNDAGFSVWDPVANVLAAARMVSMGGWSQWACKP